jgi:hypothetical protein
MMRPHIEACLLPITITGGHKAALDDYGNWLVPKKDLVSTVQVLLQSRRIKIAPALPDAQTLVQELLNFKLKVTISANDTLDDWRAGVHDDLVLAVAIAAWEGERHGSCPPPPKLNLPRRLSLQERMASGQSNAKRRGLFGL